MAGVYCPNCGRPVLGFSRATPHESKCWNCKEPVTAAWKGKQLVVTWGEN